MNLFSFFLVSLPEEITRMTTLNSWIMIIAAIFLWITFVLFGIIAKRYEKVLRKKTEWQFIIIAPSGILIYAILQLFSVFQGNLKMPVNTGRIAYSLFFISGILSLLGALRFRRVVSPKRGGYR
ncbi:MAG: hypothetical protein P8Y62_03995 [candidate division WOR-3 bacterium]|jgi:hypothetical protein